jgi:hypothetical protein
VPGGTIGTPGDGYGFWNSTRNNGYLSPSGNLGMVRRCVKLKILGDDRDARREIADDVAMRTDAALVYSVGKVIVLWRPRPLP